MSGVTTADSAARADWIGCEPNARTSAVPRMRKVDIATPFRLILRKRDLMFACLLQLTSEMRSSFETCLAAGNESLAQFRTEVAGMLVRHRCAFVTLYARRFRTAGRRQQNDLHMITPEFVLVVLTLDLDGPKAH